MARPSPGPVRETRKSWPRSGTIGIFGVVRGSFYSVINLSFHFSDMGSLSSFAADSCGALHEDPQINSYVRVERLDCKYC